MSDVSRDLDVLWSAKAVSLALYFVGAVLVYVIVGSALTKTRRTW